MHTGNIKFLYQNCTLDENITQALCGHGEELVTTVLLVYRLTAFSYALWCKRGKDQSISSSSTGQASELFPKDDPRFLHPGLIQWSHDYYSN